MSGDIDMHKCAFDLRVVKADLGKLFGAPHVRILHQHTMVLTHLGRKMALYLSGPCVAQTRRQLERRNQALRYNNRNLRHRNRNLARRDRVYRNNRWYYRRGDRYYDNTGAVLAGVIVGGAAAAIAGSALANAGQPRVVIEQPAYGVPAPYSADWYRQCDLKYNSFRASDGTYLGYDGYRHTCRLP